MASPIHPGAKESFLHAIELSEQERANYLQHLAREDPALSRQVSELLSAHVGANASALDRMPGAIGPGTSGQPRVSAAVLGDYELLEEIGSGAFGSVWRARQTSLGRIVALKLLRAGRFASAKELDRLRAEAEAIARLDHPHIVPVYEVGDHEGHAFFSMRWIEGGTLAQGLARPWPARRAARLLVEVARAVHHAHQRGLLHRDLKPSNVLLDAEGKPYVADFGIAKRLEDGARAAITESLAGSPPYMAPEQVEGGELTVETDIWALGCILYELLAGHPAFRGDSVTEVLRRVRSEEPRPLRQSRPDIARDLETIVGVCLRKEPSRRYPSADAFADDLERWLAHEPIAARRTGRLERLALFCRRSPLAATLIAIASGLVLLLAVVATWANIRLGARLRESHLGQARAMRSSGVVGSRTAALELLARAAEIRPGEDLRDEAIACLSMTDLALERSFERPAGLEARLWADTMLERLVHDDGRDLRILDLEDGSVLAELGSPGEVRYARWSARGRWLLTKHHDASGQERDARFHVWDVEARKEHLSREEALSYRSADFSPDERRLAYATLGGEVILLDLASGAERLRFGVGSRTGSLRFSPDGARLAVLVGGGQNLVQLRDPESGALLREARLEGSLFDACWTQDSLVVACGDHRLHVFDADDLRPGVECRGHSAEVVEVFASPRAPLFVSNSWDETARLWEGTTGREIRRLSARAMGFSTDGLRLATADSRGWSLWRVEHGDFLRVISVHRGKSPRDLAFSPDGRELASAGPDGVYTWDRNGTSHPRLVHSSDARAARYVAAGSALLMSGLDGLWRVELGPDSEPRKLLPGPLRGMALTADGRTLAVQGRSEIHLLDPRLPSAVVTLPGAENMEYLSISADGSRIAAGNWRGQGVRLWSPRESEQPRILLPEQVNVAVAISPDGQLLATATSERFTLRRTDSAHEMISVERWRNFGNAPAPVAFSPDGSLVAFGLSSEVVRLIDTRTLEVRGTLQPPRADTLFELAFSPDGSILGAACSTNRVHLWNLSKLMRELEALGLDAGRRGRPRRRTPAGGRPRRGSRASPYTERRRSGSSMGTRRR